MTKCGVLDDMITILIPRRRKREDRMIIESAYTRAPSTPPAGT